jgi:hypothetical protein
MIAYDVEKSIERSCPFEFEIINHDSFDAYCYIVTIIRNIYPRFQKLVENYSINFQEIISGSYIMPKFECRE